MRRRTAVSATFAALVVLLPGCGGGGKHARTSTPAVFALITPNGGDTWIVASQRVVSWFPGTYVGLVDIDLSTDGGTTWQTLLAATPNDGSQPVTVPDLPTATARLQVSAADGDPSRSAPPSDMSAADFTIQTAEFAVTVPTTVRVDTYGTLAAGDFDGDRNPDLVVAGDDQVTHLYHDAGVAGTGTFAEVASGVVGVQYGSVAWGDFDHDGDLDLAICGYAFGPQGSAYVGPVCIIYRNDGHGVFTDIHAGLVGVYYGCVAWGDFDHDGDLDLAISGDMDAYSTPGVPPNTTTRIYRNDGGGVFTNIGAVLPGVMASSLAWADIDGDGDLDLAVAGMYLSTPIARVYRNDGGTFVDSGAGLPGVSACSLAWGDFDGDGDPDLALSGYSATGPITRVFRNDLGVFTDIGAGLEGAYSGGVAWADYDQDGDLDLAVVGQSDTGPVGHVYRNDGGGVFTDSGAVVAGGMYSSLAWGDYDGDGLLDLVVAVGYPPSQTPMCHLYTN